MLPAGGLPAITSTPKKLNPADALTKGLVDAVVYRLLGLRGQQPHACRRLDENLTEPPPPPETEKHRRYTVQFRTVPRMQFTQKGGSEANRDYSLTPTAAAAAAVGRVMMRLYTDISPCNPFRL